MDLEKQRRVLSLTTGITGSSSMSRESSSMELGILIRDTDKNNNNVNEETKVFLSRQSSLDSASSQSISPYYISSDLILSFTMFVMGWYGPKYVFVPLLLVGGITQRPIPYQLTSTGNVILDFSLNYPLVPLDKVLISCT